MLIPPHIQIIRIEDAFPEGMFGNLLISSRYFCVTLEPPEFDNKKNFACILAGQYECKRVLSPTAGPTFEICNIPNRDHVLFHRLNVARQTKACVGLGEYIVRDEAAIRNSKNAFDKFMEVMKPYETFRLTIKEAWA